VQQPVRVAADMPRRRTVPALTATARRANVAATPGISR